MTHIDPAEIDFGGDDDAQESHSSAMSRSRSPPWRNCRSPRRSRAMSRSLTPRRSRNSAVAEPSPRSAVAGPIAYVAQ